MCSEAACVMRSIRSSKIGYSVPPRVMNNLAEHQDVQLHDRRAIGRWSGLGMCTASSYAALIQGLLGT